MRTRRPASSLQHSSMITRTSACAAWKAAMSPGRNCVMAEVLPCTRSTCWRPARIVAHLGAHVVHAGDHLARQHQQPFAGRRRFQPARMALEQLGLELVFEQRQATAGSRHGDVTRLGRARQVAELGGVDEQRERVDIGQHRETIVKWPHRSRGWGDPAVAHPAFEGGRLPRCRRVKASLPTFQFPRAALLPTVRAVPRPPRSGVALPASKPLAGDLRHEEDVHRRPVGRAA